MTLVDTSDPVLVATAAPGGDRAAGPGAAGLRLVDATLRCVARWGVAKTSLDDVAREAGCSRATVYRVVPGGKDGLIDLVVRVEIERLLAAVAARLETADDLESLLALGMAEAARRIREHGSLQYLLAHEPETIVPHLAFSHFTEVLAVARDFARPWIMRWLPDGQDAGRAAEWITRLVLSYVTCPAEDMDLADEDAARCLVRTYVLPGLQTTVRS